MSPLPYGFRALQIGIHDVQIVSSNFSSTAPPKSRFPLIRLPSLSSQSAVIPTARGSVADRAWEVDPPVCSGTWSLRLAVTAIYCLCPTLYPIAAAVPQSVRASVINTWPQASFLSKSLTTRLSIHPPPLLPLLPCIPSIPLPPSPIRLYPLQLLILLLLDLRRRAT